jgi:hypothetical protein
MKSFAVLSLLPHILAASVAAFPAVEQTPLGELSNGGFVGNLFGQLAHGVEHAIHDVFGSKPKQELDKWIENGKELIQKGGIVCKAAPLSFVYFNCIVIMALHS